jgi:hypothetical protein
MHVGNLPSGAPPARLHVAIRLEGKGKDLLWSCRRFMCYLDHLQATAEVASSHCASATARYPH